jgi:hypothetical protein
VGMGFSIKPPRRLPKKGETVTVTPMYRVNTKCYFAGYNVPAVCT